MIIRPFILMLIVILNFDNQFNRLPLVIIFFIAVSLVFVDEQKINKLI
jgi:hypothetical protein